MKPILAMILLFLALTTAGAQTDWKRVVEMPSYTVVVDSVRPVRPLTEKEIVTRLMEDTRAYAWLRLYSRYEKECYADSTFSKVMEWWERKTDGMGKATPFAEEDRKRFRRNGYKQRMDTVYTHRQPAFSDFIEYLRGKK